jgi:signal transduction histidine kinase
LLSHVIFVNGSHPGGFLFLRGRIDTPLTTIMLVYMAKTKTTTIDDLARMINEGFKTTASKEDIKQVREDIAEINSRLDKIEQQILVDYGRRIEALEQELKRLKDALAV